MLVFSHSESIFGKSFEALHREILSDYDPADFSLQLETSGLDHVADLEVIVPNSMLLIHYDCIIGEQSCDTLLERLRNTVFPKTTFIVIAYDDDAFDITDDPEGDIKAQVPIDDIGPHCLVFDHWKSIVGAGQLYVKSHSRELHGTAALDAIVTWNNQAYDRLYN